MSPFPHELPTHPQTFELASNSGARECFQIDGFHEIITKKEDFYKVKNVFENKIDNFAYSAIEWRAITSLKLDKEQSKKMIEVLSNLEELDDVQNVFSNANIVS